MQTDQSGRDVRLSIVVVTWNNAAFIHRCLNSIFAAAPDDDFEVIVVDNRSDDDTCRIVRDEFPAVHLIEAKENGGFAKGNNVGYTASSGRYVLMLNPDAFLDYGWPDVLLEHMEAHPEVGVMGCNLRREDGSPNCSYGSTSFINIVAPLFSIPYRWLKSCSNGLAPPVPIEVDCVSGAFLLTKRDVIAHVGFLDERFFAYFEETDFCFRVRKAGLRVIHVPSFRVTHLGGASFGQWDDAGIGIYYRSMFHFIGKNYGLLGKSACVAAIVRCLVKFLSYAIVLLVLPIRHVRQGLKKYAKLLQTYCQGGRTS